ncbi:cytochrome C oxidase subunit IV family protein [Nocardia sp. NBC_01730]|uniref:cytochrome C oxidase subunit IV family protein n=1 Tax=Nocardia sp. NBC_01730 TaxID=2975998 RepID=UPI002E144501|nr:cytochrome C oxidase subunit IV family protein [Nocardia sp. NBC_01730]
MNADRRTMTAWIALSGLTLIYIWIDRSVDHDGMLQANRVVTASAIVIALVKVRIIFREFMEVRHATALLRRLTDIWLVIVAVSLLSSYLISVWIST